MVPKQSRTYDVGPGFVRARECPDCFHTKCGEDCACNCDAARAEHEAAQLRAEVERLRDKARRFKGWRVRYEWRHRPGYEWVKCFDEVPSRDAAARCARRNCDDADHYRNVTLHRVYRRAKGAK